MRKVLILAVIAACMLLTACYTHTHIIGNGPQGNTVVTARQWYAVYGLAALNNVDTKTMAGEAKDYKIVTQQTFVDGIINAFTSSFTVSCRTVTVTK